ncbi:MAG TPA: outer membrane protein [Xanthobacteraceae bacterium]|nr:outer membrane protein [Xanthobacteraceae bacterium]
MKKLLLSTTALIAFAGAAHSADMPVKAPMYPPVVPYSWTGCYIGGNVGYGWANVHSTITVSVVPTPDPTSPTVNGVIGGAQIGCNYQTGQWVWGIEGDFQGSDQHKTTAVTIGATTVTQKDSIPWFGTFRGRVGFTPWERVMLYVTGGGGYARTTADLVITNGGVTGASSASNDRAFWTVGGGIEWVLVGNWTAKVEYLYLDMGSFSQTAASVNGAIVTDNVRFKDNIARFGVNYRF